MSKDVSGSIRKVTIDGVTYDVAADTNANAVPSQLKNEAVASSGRNMRKMTRQSQDVKSMVIICNGGERETLEAVAEGLDDVTLSYETAAGDVYRATGWIDFESWENQDNHATLTLYPRQKWQSFTAA